MSDTYNKETQTPGGWAKIQGVDARGGAAVGVLSPLVRSVGVAGATDSASARSDGGQRSPESRRETGACSISGYIVPIGVVWDAVRWAHRRPHLVTRRIDDPVTIRVPGSRLDLVRGRMRVRSAS